MTTSPMSAAGSAGLYPIPQVIPFDQLGFQGATRQAAIDLFIRVGRNEDIQWRYRFVPTQGKTDVFPVTAFKVMRMMQFGRVAKSDEWQAIHGTLTQHFFPGVNFFGDNGRVQPVEVQLREKNPFPDGDTASVIRFKAGEDWQEAHADALIDGAWGAYEDTLVDGHWIPYKTSVRMDGVDSAESYRRSEKYARNVVGIANYLQMTYAISEKEREALIALVGARIAYLGKVAGAVTQGFGEHFADIGIRLGPAYSLLGAEKGLADTLDLWDKYGRIIGRILAGRENEGEDLLAGFIQAVLPRYMRTVAEEKHLAAYREEVAPYAEVLAGWRGDKDQSALFDILGPESAPVPTEIFSPEICEGLASMWTDFVAIHPEAKNDLQTASALIGTAPPYPKYPGHMAMTDLRAEQIALGAVRSISGGHGLTVDPISKLLRPSANPDDPYRSLAYSDPVIGLYMSGIEDISILDPLNLHGRILEGSE
ncbi:MAG: hypothetical protein HN337_06650 [Deltaproteobacteria bacterium]|jgi:hypothetical protein|nr:hypothetical protein [Deltaproteobacteria bacterium]